MSDFYQIFRECLFYGYLTSLRKWDHLDHFKKKYDKCCVFAYNMGFPIYFLPPSDKTAIFFFLGMQMTQNLQETCKTKL